MNSRSFDDFSQDYLRGLLAKCRDVRIGVLGDFCLDAYLVVDNSAAEVSQETGLSTRPVAEQRYELGGAGNVVNNMAAIGCNRIESFGVIGPDPWGYEMSRLLTGLNVSVDGLLMQKNDWATPVYVKPLEGGIETARLDFGSFNQLHEQTAQALLAKLTERLPDLDVVVVNQQLCAGIHTDDFRKQLAEMISSSPDKTFIVDSRHFAAEFPGACLKISDHEAARHFGVGYSREALVLKEVAHKAACDLFEKMESPVFVSRGARGVVVQDTNGLAEVPGIQLLGRVDTVGAGDSMLAGIALALGAKAPPIAAAMLGNIVASITVEKINQTGTATPEEILTVGAKPDYIYRPELAEDPRQIQIIPFSEFERVSDRQPSKKITHVIFDHDGTISTLRQGWEEIMEPMMIRAILGPQYDTADDSFYHRIATRVRDFIDKSTGIQTLIQMQGLVKMVSEFDCVPEAEILDEHGYKKIYNDELVKLVRARVAKFENGELDVSDYTLKNAVKLLHALHDHGATLYLASGTDEQDVIAEAKALGYDELFGGGIYGAVGDATKDAKRMVLDRILNEIGTAEGLVTLGDGPVEIRETQKRGGFTIGVASDEVRRFGIDLAKRSRLIRAGADMIVPDFSQLNALLELLHIKR
jgi:bifunctional ADP-heptose synthase (sugar kinase/adenylyltransferase)/phosphoglycolate phosphatase-like HAD superfamily hydrolase